VILVTGVRPTESSGIVTGVMGLCKKNKSSSLVLEAVWKSYTTIQVIITRSD